MSVTRFEVRADGSLRIHELRVRVDAATINALDGERLEMLGRAAELIEEAFAPSEAPVGPTTADYTMDEPRSVAQQIEDTITEKWTPARRGDPVHPVEALASVRAERDLLLERVHRRYHRYHGAGECPYCAELTRAGVKP